MNQIQYRHNSLGIVCLGEDLHEKLFGYRPATEEDLNLIIDKFSDIVTTKSVEKPAPLPTETLPEIPSLPYGNNVEEYFHQVAQNYYDTHDLDRKISDLLSIDKGDINDARDMIEDLILYSVAGKWNKIVFGGEVQQIDELDSDAMVFDTETFVKGSDCNSPIVAQAIGRDRNGTVALYMWLHPCFDYDMVYEPMKVSVGQNKLLVGHNFAFDRQKIKEFYSLNKSTNICVCTMAMMQLVAGVDDKQRWMLNTKDNFAKARNIRRIGCKLGLIPCYEFMTGKKAPPDAKKLRDVFVKAKEFAEFIENKQAILEYSMLDVIYNLQLFQKAYPVFQEMANHKAILAGQTLVMDAIVPHISYWDEWVARCDREYDKICQQIYDIVFPYVKEIHDTFWLNSEIMLDAEINKMNWDLVRPFRYRKDKPLPEGWPIRAKWFEPFRKGEIKLKGRDLQILLMTEYCYNEKWYRVIYTRKDAFHIIVNDKVIKLPNRKNPGENYGSILSADSLFLVDREKPLLRSILLSDEEFKKVLKLFDLTTTYTGFRNRVISQNKENGLVAAEVKPAGTISGRTVSSLYNTLPAHWNEAKIMSEIKMTSQTPAGYVFVGGDADQQEASVAAAMGDAKYHMSGGCPFSAAVIAGTKDEQTDYHSLTAKNVTGKEKIDGSERFGAKGVNFGLIYGAGVKTTAKTISFNFGYEDEKALSKSRNAVAGFKGTVDQFTKGSGYTEYESGIASDVFNKMLDMIRNDPPRGLFFDNVWPRSLHPKYCRDAGSPPQLNYCIQASCSTYGFLSAWALATYDEMARNNLDARFSISIHDEMWWLVEEKDAKRVAFWQMICYARTWALLSHKLGIEDLPFNRAFPSSISIDKILRKSHTASTKTPSFDEHPAGSEVTIFDYYDETK